MNPVLGLFLFTVVVGAAMMGLVYFALNSINNKEKHERAIRKARWRNGIGCGGCGLISDQRSRFEPCPECGETKCNTVVYRIIEGRVETKNENITYY